MSLNQHAAGRGAAVTSAAAQTEKPHLLSLRGPLVIAYADAIRRDLLRAIEWHDSVLIDCAQATDADLSLVQLLIAAGRSAAAAKTSIRLERISPAVTAALTAGGFSAEALFQS